MDLDAESLRLPYRHLAHRRAVRVREGDVCGLGPVVEGVLAAASAVHQLVADHEMTWLHVRPQRSHGAWADDAAHSDLLHGPRVGPVRDAVGRQLVLEPVPGDEGDAPPGHVADGDGSGGGAERRVDLDLFDVLQE